MRAWTARFRIWWISTAIIYAFFSAVSGNAIKLIGGSITGIIVLPGAKAEETLEDSVSGWSVRMQQTSIWISIFSEILIESWETTIGAKEIWEWGPEESQIVALPGDGLIPVGTYFYKSEG